MSILFIILSTCMLVLGTTKWFQEMMDSLYQPTRLPSCSSRQANNSNSAGNTSTTLNATGCAGNSTCEQQQQQNQCEEDDLNELRDHPLVSFVEMVCIIWFTFEFLLRFCASPNKRKFANNTLNIIDVLSILPYYVGASIASYSVSITSKFTTVRKLLQLLRILRILRVFKIARHSTGLKALGYTVRQSYRELGMIVLFLVVGVLFFSTLCYYVEKDAVDSKFTSIPEAFWYTAISMTVSLFRINLLVIRTQFTTFCVPIAWLPKTDYEIIFLILQYPIIWSDSSKHFVAINCRRCSFY